LRRPPRFDARWLLVDAPLDALEPRIRTRARAMFDHGLLDEAKALRARLPAGHRLLDTLGIAEALAVADGAIDVDTALARTSLRTRQYARRQRTWFKKESWWTKLDATSATLVHDALSLLGEAR
jgi:tRNA dimethylallyltransferase